MCVAYPGKVLSIENEAKEWIALFRDLEETTADAADEIKDAAQEESETAASSVSETEDIHHA